LARAAKEKEVLQKSEDDKTELVSKAEQDRLQSAKNTNELLLAEREGLAEEELEVLREFQEIENEAKEAVLIKDDERRELEKENLAIRQEEAIASLQGFLKKKEDKNKQYSDLINKNDNLNDTQRLKKQKEFDVATTKDRELLFKNEKAMAEQRMQHNAVINQTLIDGGFAVASALVSASGGSAKKQFAIQKTLGIAQILINGQMAAALAIASIPPPFGEAAAATRLAQSQIQAGIVAATSAIQFSAMQTGGFVPNGLGGARDRIPTMLEPNELVVPAAVVPSFIQAVGQPQSGDFGNDDASSSGNGESVMRFEGDLIQNEEFVAAFATKYRELQENENLR